MINHELFHVLAKTPHISGQIQTIHRSPEAPCYGYLEKGFAYEFYQTDKNQQLVSWFWWDEEFVIPSSPYSNIVLSEDAEFYDLEYRHTFRCLREYKEDRDFYYFIRAQHKLRTAKRIDDIHYQSPFKNYMKLKERIPEIFNYVSEEQIASFLNIDISELRRFMLKRPVPS